MRDEALEQEFRGLRPGQYRLTSKQTRRYNCIAWAAGDNTRWWWPTRFQNEYWPPELPRVVTLQNFIDAFALQGYEPCDGPSQEENFEKVAIYVNAEGTPTHAARQLPCGFWASKLGNYVDIEHLLPEDVATTEAGESSYGTVATWMKRPSGHPLPVIRPSELL